MEARLCFKAHLAKRGSGGGGSRFVTPRKWMRAGIDAKESAEKNMIGDGSTASWRRRTHFPDCHISERFSAAAVSSDSPFNFRQFGDLERRAWHSQMHIRTHASFKAGIPNPLLGFDDMYPLSGSILTIFAVSRSTLGSRPLPRRT